MKQTDLASIEITDKEMAEVPTVEKLPPWAIAMNKITALFGGDPDLDIDCTNVAQTHTISITSNDYHKLEALSQVLKSEIDGLTIKLVNTGLDNPYARTIEDVFKNNPHFKDVRLATEAGTGLKHIITTFKDETIQYKADNRFVPHGYETTLAEKLIKDLFNEEFRRSVYVTEEKSNYMLTKNQIAIGKGCWENLLTTTGAIASVRD